MDEEKLTSAIFMALHPFASWAILLCGTTLPFFASAHGLGGFGIDKEVDGMLIDISFSQLALHPNQSSIIDFQLWKNMPEYEMVQFTAVVVEIMRGNELVFNTRIEKAPLGWTGMNFTFPASGNYTLFLDFQNGKESIVKNTFPVIVKEPKSLLRIVRHFFHILTSILSIGFLWIVGKKLHRFYTQIA